MKYPSNALFQDFTRFLCEIGYPERLLTDEGSRLVKSCGTLKFYYHNIQWSLFTEHHVEFDTCPVTYFQRETFSARAAYFINDLPLGIRDYDGNFET